MTVVSGFKSYPQSWCHMPTLFSEISKISHVLHLWWLLVTQQGFTNFLCLTWSAVISVTQLWQSCHPNVDTSEVMKQNVSTNFPALQMHNSNMTVVLGSKSYPQSWCHMPTLFWQKKWDISHFAPAMTFGDFQQGFTNCLLSDMISGHQCNSTITVMSSWSRYIKSYEAKHFYELPSPTNAHFQHDSCVRLQELPSKLVSHAYLIFRNKQDISRFAPLVTFGDSAGFHQFSMSDMISSHQCNSTMTVMSS